LKAVKIALIIVLAAILIIYFFRAVLWVKKGIQQYSSQRAKQVELKKAAEPKKSRDKKAASKSAARTAAVQKTLPAAKVISIPQGEKLKLSIAASEDVWTELKVDGKVIFSGVIKKGSLETWEADNQFTLWTGNASVIKLGLNGNDLGSPGRGVIKDIVINRQGIKNGR